MSGGPDDAPELLMMKQRQAPGGPAGPLAAASAAGAVLLPGAVPFGQQACYDGMVRLVYRVPAGSGSGRQQADGTGWLTAAAAAAAAANRGGSGGGSDK